jgi:hypothetical protein
MAETLRILGTSELSTGYVVLFEVGKPPSENIPTLVPQAVVSSIVVCETAGSAATVTIRVIPKNVTGGTKNIIFNELALTSKETKVIAPGITLSTEDSIDAKANTGAANIFIFGSEIR